jgi:hypothetical protein
VAKCGSLWEIEVDVNLLAQLKKRLKALKNYVLKQGWKLIFDGVV